jgi:uncharacterized protein with HEPN domain
MQKNHLLKILALETIEKILSIDIWTEQEFIDENNRVIQSAIIMQLIHLVELTKNLASNNPNLQRQLELKKMSWLRNIAAHDYIAVDMSIVRDVVINYLPELKKHLENIY